MQKKMLLRSKPVSFPKIDNFPFRFQNMNNFHFPVSISRWEQILYIYKINTHEKIIHLQKILSHKKMFLFSTLNRFTFLFPFPHKKIDIARNENKSKLSSIFSLLSADTDSVHYVPVHWHHLGIRFGILILGFISKIVSELNSGSTGYTKKKNNISYFYWDYTVGHYLGNLFYANIFQYQPKFLKRK